MRPTRSRPPLMQRPLMERHRARPSRVKLSSEALLPPSGVTIG